METNISFLSKDNLIKHNEYLKRLKLEYAILEKSYTELKGLCSKEILRTNLQREIRLEAYSSKIEIELHELFFSSFSELHTVSKFPFVNSFTQASFLYDAEEKIKCTNAQFIIFYKTKSGFLKYQLLKNFSDALEAEPHLCIDLCEHSYFSDYGFDRQRYVKEALFHLNFNKFN